MFKLKLLFLLLFKISLINSLFSSNLALEMFTLGMEFKFGNSEEMNVTVGLPTLYLMDSNKILHLTVQPGEFILDDKLQYKSSVFFRTDLMGALNIEDTFFVGPFVNAGLKSLYGPEFSLNTGFRFHSVAEFNFFGDLIPSYMRIITCDFGYSIDEDRYYIKGSADFLIGLIVAGVSYLTTMADSARTEN